MTKPERAKLALSHIEFCERYYRKEIANSIEYSKVYDFSNGGTDNVKAVLNTDTLITITDDSTVSAILKTDVNDKVAALNFASFKYPGGGFVKGMFAQEEALCTESTLYSVLSSDKIVHEFYDINRMDLHKGAYADRVCYSPKIQFMRDELTRDCDIITCAAPNRTYAMRYSHSDLSAVTKAMESRIDSVLYSAYDNKVDTIIIGAFGCGVFKNDPTYVATTFKNFLNTKYSRVFKKVWIAIPNNSSKNYIEFANVFEK